MKSKGLILSLVLSMWAAACQATPTEEMIVVDEGPCMDRVLVEVWNDLDGDGEIDPGEPPVPDALIILARQGAPTEENIQTQTNAEGRAYFGAFEMDNCSPEGYEVLFARSVPGFAFPENPAFRLDGFDMLHDTVYFGLQLEGSTAE
ncbi:MAG: hypothetical protein PVG63_05980 [Anaerolineales bacterium]